MLKVSRLSIKKEKLSLFLVILFVLFLLVFVFYAISRRISFLKKATGPQLSESSAQPVRGRAGDLWADVVLGQRNFNEIAPYETVADRLFNPGGVVIDKTVTPNILYVLDSANNRVLGINLEECLQMKRTDPNSRCQAVRVIGQPDLNSNACNGDSGFQNYPNRAPASAESFCYLPEKATSPNEGGNAAGLFIDTEGNLFLPDIHNNRLLEYNRISSADNIADEVWGQADFSGNQCNRGGQPTAESLCLAEGNYSASAVLDQPGHLWLTDSSNNRVLRYPKQGDGSISERADLVLGQTNFNSNFQGSSLDKFFNPSGLDFDSEGKLYVVDQRNDRVLIFSPPFTNGMTGQLFGRNFKLPVHIKIERIGPGQDKIWISDIHNNMIEVWNNQGTEVLKVFGQESYSPSLQSNRGDLCDPFGSFDYDSEGSLYTTNRCEIYASEILFFPNLPGNVRQSSFRVFAPIAGNKNLYNFMGNRGFDSGRGIVVTDDQIIINDKNRLLFWNNPQNLFNGRPIDGLIGGENSLKPDGQPNFESFGSSKSFLKKDNLGNLWVTTDYYEDKPSSIEIFRLPLTTGQNPIKSFPFDRNRCFSNLEGERICNLDPSWSLVGLAPAPDANFVWVSHPLTNRVFRIRDPLINPRVDVVLGQENTSEICCNQEKNPDGSCKQWDLTTRNPSLDKLCLPGAVSLDNRGFLYIADSYLEGAGNFRILIFRPEDLPTDNTQTLYGVSAVKEIKNIAAFDMAFDSQNRMIVGQNGLKEDVFPLSRFLVFFNNPLENNTNLPDGRFNDYNCLPFGVALDRFNNLYVTDHNWARVLVYQNPFSSPLPSPRPSNTPGPTLTPTPTSPPVPTNTSTPTPTLAMPSCFGYDAGVLGRGLAVNYNFSGNNPHPLAKLQTKAFYKKTGRPWLALGEILRWSGRDYSIHTSQTSSLLPGFYQTSAEMVVFYDLNNNNIPNSNEPKLFCRAGSCSNCQETVEIPPLTNCPLEVNQWEGSAPSRLTNQYYGQYVLFSPYASGLVNKVAIKATNGSVVLRRVTCKITDQDDRALSLERSSSFINKDNSPAWLEIDYSDRPFRIVAGESYKLYCKGPDPYVTLFWLWTVNSSYPYPERGRPERGRTIRVYACPE